MTHRNCVKKTAKTVLDIGLRYVVKEVVLHPLHREVEHLRLHEVGELVEPSQTLLNLLSKGLSSGSGFVLVNNPDRLFLGLRQELVSNTVGVDCIGGVVS